MLTILMEGWGGEEDKITGGGQAKELRGQGLGKLCMSPHGPKVTKDYGRSTENDREPKVKTHRVRGMPRLCRICKGDKGSVMMPWSDG
jgi:hypothetical protein